MNKLHYVLVVLLLFVVMLWVAYDIGWHVGWSQRHQIEVEIIESNPTTHTADPSPSISEEDNEALENMPLDPNEGG